MLKARTVDGRGFARHSKDGAGLDPNACQLRAISIKAAPGREEVRVIIAERVLSYRTDGSELQIEVLISTPERDGSSWVCRYEIDWPHERRYSFSAGIDAVQALHLTLQKICIDIYMSEYHASGRLSWGETGAGYGFPVPRTGRDLLIGDDLNFEG